MDFNPETSDKSSAMKLIQSTDKAFILARHEEHLAEHKKIMNVEEDAFARFGSAISFSDIDQESGPPARHSAQVEFIPANRVDISTLTDNANKVLDGKYFLCRTIVPSYRFCAIEAIVEDPRGQQGIWLSMYNYSSLDKCSYDDLLEKLPVAQILAIKNPWLKSLEDGTFFLKCNNPEDVVLISESVSQELFPGGKWEGNIPEKWQIFIQSAPQTPIEWKNQGNKEFVLQKYEKALQSYTKGMNLLDNAGTSTSSTVQVRCDFLANRAAAYLKLDCFQSALEDVDKLLKIDPTHFKGMYRKGKALLGLQRFQEAIHFLKLSSLGNLDSENKKMFMELLELAQDMLKQQTTGEYDLLKLYKAGDVRHADCADFLGPVKIQEISGCGRGLVATQNIQPGQLISATKAFQIVFPAQEQGVFQNTHVQFQQKLIQKIAHKLTLEPHLCRTFYQLYAGTDIPIYDPEKDSSVVDLERITAIRRNNTFIGNTPNFEETSRPPCAYVNLKSLGVWILPSYLNHRCWDHNAIWTIFGDMIFVRALKDIPIGEEILINYADPIQMYEEREKVFKYQGFMCECQLCQIDRDDSTEGLKRMELLKKIQKVRNSGRENNIMEIEATMKEIEKLDSKGGHNLQLNPALTYAIRDLISFYSKSDVQKTVDLFLKVHALLTNTVYKQLALESCIQLITLYLMTGKVEDAKKWTATWKKELMTLYGTLDVAKLMGSETAEALDLMGKFKIFLE